MTLAALGLRGLTGEVSIVSEGKDFRVAFDRGNVVGAYSPLVNDAAVRLALTAGLVTSTQVAELSRRMAAMGGRDEMDVLAELARIPADQVARLRRRLIAQRAARTLQLQHGEFVVDSVVSIPVWPDCALDVRSIVYLGAKNNMTEETLAEELARFGGWFQLKQEAREGLAQYGFTEAEKPVLRGLLAGADLVDLEQEHAEIGARAIRAVTFALVACTACNVGPPRGAAAVATATADTPSQAIPAVGTASDLSGRMVTGGRSGAVRTPSHGIPAVGTASDRSGRVATGPRAASAATPSQAIPVVGTASELSGRVATGGRSGAARTPSHGTPVVGAASELSGRVATGPRASTSATPSQAIPVVGTASELSGATSSGIRSGAARTPSHGTSITQGAGRAGTASGAATPSRSGSMAAVVPAAEPSAAGAPAGGPTPDGAGGRAGPLPRRARRNSSVIVEVQQILADKLPLLDHGIDHYSLLGVTMSATPEQIRKTYFDLARKLHPDRVQASGAVDEVAGAQRLMAQINAAFAVLNDATRRAEYDGVLMAGGEEAVRAQEEQVDQTAMKALQAEQAFKQGEQALRRDQIQVALEQLKLAVELEPNDPEFQALYAWARFAAAPDKNKVAAGIRRELQLAADASKGKVVSPVFYLGRLERILGKEREALQLFQRVLAVNPRHAEAASEARLLEQRLKSKR